MWWQTINSQSIQKLSLIAIDFIVIINCFIKLFQISRALLKRPRTSFFYVISAYMSCNVRLISPGTLKCSQPTIEPLFCDISCNEYDDNAAITNQRFTCVNETFEASLPHCAKVAPSGMYLYLQ